MSYPFYRRSFVLLKSIIMQNTHYFNLPGYYTANEGDRMAKPRKTPVGARNIVGAKVERVRREKNIKQKELAAALQSRGMDISETSLSRLEGQHRLVQDFELPILADALGVSVEWLLKREDA